MNYISKIKLGNNQEYFLMTKERLPKVFDKNNVSGLLYRNFESEAWGCIEKGVVYQDGEIMFQKSPKPRKLTTQEQEFYSRYGLDPRTHQKAFDSYVRDKQARRGIGIS